MKPLEYDAKVTKEFGITDVDDIEDEIKLGYVRAQLDEVKKFMWRERVDLQLAEAQAKSKIEALAAKAQSDIAAHRSNLVGVLASIRVLTELKDALETRVTS